MVNLQFSFTKKLSLKQGKTRDLAIAKKKSKKIKKSVDINYALC